MNKIKKFLTALMAVALVLCVGYFSGMSKTSAWFYDSGVIDSGDRFVFGNLSVNTKFVINHSVIFDAATKLADKNETDFYIFLQGQKIFAQNTTESFCAKQQNRQRNA